MLIGDPTCGVQMECLFIGWVDDVWVEAVAQDVKKFT